jgi:hypothetical protein
VANGLWYSWNLLNVQLLAPLFLSFLAGMVVAVTRFWRERRPDDYTPELLAGGLVSFLGVTYITLKDSRYSLAVLVYVAALGVAWVPALRTVRLRAAAAGAIVVVALINLIGVSGGLGENVIVNADPGHPPTALGERSARIYTPAGFIANAPRDDGDVLRVMRGLREAGYQRLLFEPNGDVTFSSTGLTVLQAIAGLEFPAAADLANLPPRTPYLLRQPIAPDGPAPCGRVSGGWGVYVALQKNVLVPFQNYRFICPL